MTDGWSRKQYATLETRLGEAADIIEELWQEGSKLFANWPMHLQRSEKGEAEMLRLYHMETLILNLHAMIEAVDGLDRPMILQRSQTDALPPPRRPLPLLDRLSR